MEAATVAAFLAVDLALVFTPGADWAFAIGAGLRSRALVPAVAGLVTGYAGYTLLATAGLVVIVAGSPGLLTALTVLGAVYLTWLGWTTLTRPPGPRVDTDDPETSVWRVTLKGVGVSGLNPKGMLVFFSLFPQFVDPGSGWPVAAQTAALGAIHMAGCAVVYLGVGVLARTVLTARPAAARAVTRVSGVLMISFGGILLIDHVI